MYYPLKHADKPRFNFYLSSNFTDGALCAAVETGFIGHFRSLDTDGDGLYENSINCRWHILSPFPEARQSKKEVYVTDFNVQDTEDCAFDYVKVVLLFVPRGENLRHDHLFFKRK